MFFGSIISKCMYVFFILENKQVDDTNWELMEKLQLEIFFCTGTIKQAWSTVVQYQSEERLRVFH